LVIGVILIPSILDEGNNSSFEGCGFCIRGFGCKNRRVFWELAMNGIFTITGVTHSNVHPTNHPKNLLDDYLPSSGELIILRFRYLSTESELVFTQAGSHTTRQ